MQESDTARNGAEYCMSEEVVLHPGIVMEVENCPLVDHFPKNRRLSISMAISGNIRFKQAKQVEEALSNCQTCAFLRLASARF